MCDAPCRCVASRKRDDFNDQDRTSGPSGWFGMVALPKQHAGKNKTSELQRLNKESQWGS